MSKTVNVILMRGLLGQRYSRGMDRLGARLAKIPGIDYVTVEDYASWRSIRDRIAAWRDPTVIGGHSFGANASTIIAKALRGRTEVPLIISVDPSPYWSFFLWQFGPSRVAHNVHRVVNFYQPHGVIGRQQLEPAPGSATVIENVVVEDSTHGSIDDHVQLVHDPAVDAIVKVIDS
jgi:pimeloyl-ACP methyl ester carboxylesterase